LPYLWAQRLAGLDFLSVKPSEDPEKIVKMVPSMDLSKLKYWLTSDWEHRVVDSDCSLHKAVVTRDKAILTFMVSNRPLLPHYHPCLLPVLAAEQQHGNEKDVLDDGGLGEGGGGSRPLTLAVCCW